MRSLLRRLATALLCLAVHAPQARAQVAGDYFPPPEAQGGWRSLVPYNAAPTPPQRDDVRRLARMDTDRLLLAKDLLAPHGGSLLVIRRGYVVSEWGATGTTQHVASIAKSLTGMAFMALLDESDEGAFGPPMQLSDPAMQWLPNAWWSNDPSKAEVRLEHLLSMSSGLRFHDSPSPTSAYRRLVLTQPHDHTPGTRFTYSSLPVDLLSLLVSQASGVTLRDYFRSRVGDPIGMAHFGWQFMGPYTTGSAFAYISARELARPMYLLLRDGRWDGQEVLSPERSATLRRVSPANAGALFGTPNSPFVTDPLAPAYYGHLFWTHHQQLSPLGPAVPEDAFYMAGHGTQFVLGVPSEDLIVVRLGPGPDPFDELLFGAVAEAVMDSIVRTPRRDARRLWRGLRTR